MKRQLEQVNRNLREIQKVAQIGQWMYNTRDNVFYYMGYTGVLCEESSRSISLEKNCIPELAIKVWTISLVLFWGYHILRLHSAQWYGVAANINNFVRKANIFLNQ